MSVTLNNLLLRMTKIIISSPIDSEMIIKGSVNNLFNHTPSGFSTIINSYGRKGYRRGMYGRSSIKCKAIPIKKVTTKSIKDILIPDIYVTNMWGIENKSEIKRIDKCIPKNGSSFFKNNPLKYSSSVIPINTENPNIQGNMEIILSRLFFCSDRSKPAITKIINVDKLIIVHNLALPF